MAEGEPSWERAEAPLSCSVCPANGTGPSPPPPVMSLDASAWEGCDGRGGTVATWRWLCLQAHSLRDTAPSSREARPLVLSLQPRSLLRLFPDQDFGEKIELLDLNYWTFK